MYVLKLSRSFDSKGWKQNRRQLKTMNNVRKNGHNIKAKYVMRGWNKSCAIPLGRKMVTLHISNMPIAALY